MTQRSRPRSSLFRRILSTGLAACFAASGGCHRSSGQDEADGGVDAGRTDGAVPLDARVRDTAVEDTATFDGGFDSGFDAGFDAPAPCPEPSLVESFHPEADETNYGRALALSADGSTLAVSSHDSLSIYDRNEDGWMRVYRRTVIVSEMVLYVPGAVDIDNSGDTVIWGSAISTESSPNYSAALVFERQARGEWRETTIERTPDTFVTNTGVSISGDGSTLAVRDDGGGGGVYLRIFERSEAGEWPQSHVIELEVGTSRGTTVVELSEAGDRVLWLTTVYSSFAIHRKEASGEWVLEHEISGLGAVSPVLDAAGERFVVRDPAGTIFVYDRSGTTWAESSRFPLPSIEGRVARPIAIAPSGEEIYVGASTECGVAVLSWSQRGSDWVESTTQQTGAMLGVDHRLLLSLSAAGNGTVALAVPDDIITTEERTPPEVVGVYLVR
ncbi:MAG: hypothetical protein AB8H86_31875 [Polyangiales bacterium]